MDIAKGSGASSTPTLHDAAGNLCRERSLNTFEQGSSDPLPPCGVDCDVFSQVTRGAITKGFNIGLKHQQSKPLNVETYNQGCLNPWGCVDNGAFACEGGASRFGPFMDARFAELNKPYDPSALEFNPPRYMMGVKDLTPNSVSGWGKTSTGRLVWAANADVTVPCAKN